MGCGARRQVLKLGASVHSASQFRRRAGYGECSSSARRGRTRAMTCGAQPNQRVKLAAPALNAHGFRLAGRLATILFVNTSVWRRSLRAFR